MRNPFMLRSTHEKLASKAWREFHENYRRTIKRLREENECERTAINAIIRRFTRCGYPKYLPDSGTFRVSLSWSEELVHRCLEHGNGQDEIDVLAESMMWRIKDAIQSMNFYRRSHDT